MGNPASQLPRAGDPERQRVVAVCDRQVGPGLDPLDERHDVVGWYLEIGVEGADEVGLGHPHAGGDRGAPSEVLGLAMEADVRIARRHGERLPPRRIGAAVVHQDQLRLQSEERARRLQALDGGSEVRGLVVVREHDGEAPRAGGPCRQRRAILVGGSHGASMVADFFPLGSAARGAV